MKKLLSILTISTLTASVPAPLLANTVQTRVKRDVSTLTPNSNNDYLPLKENIFIPKDIVSFTVVGKGDIYYLNVDFFVLKQGATTPTKINGINDKINDFVVAVDSKDNIYFGTTNSIYVLNDGSDTATKINNINASYITKILVDSKNNIYFMSADGAFVLKQGATTPTKINGIGGYLTSIAVDSKDNIYFGTKDGAYKLSAGSDTATKIDGISNNIQSITIDNSKNIYFGTDSGAYFTTTVLDWVKQQSQFVLVDSSKTQTWTRPDLLSVDGELNIDIANPNIDKVVFDNVQQGQTNKHWTINVKPETAPRDHNLQVMFTLDGKQYTSEIIVSMQAKIEPPVPTVKQNLSELIKTTDLGNIIDNNDNTISAAVNQKNGNVIDDFSQIEISKKDNNSATLFAKEGSKSYAGSVDVTYNVVPATTVDLKIDVTSSSTATVIKDYLGQIDTSNITTPVNIFYYANSESTIKMIKPTPSSVITGVAYGCDDKWNKTLQSSTIDPTSGIKLDGSQLATNNGKYVIELSDNLGHTNNVYLQINDVKTIKNYFDTDKGKQFELWAKANGHDNIRGYGASQLNKLFAESKNWQKLASDSQFASAVTDWFKTNGKLSSTEPLTKEQVIEQLRTQIPNDIKIAGVNTSNYDVNKVSFELNQNEFNPNDKVNITVKYNNATAEQFTLQIKDSNTPDNNKKSGLGTWSIFGIVVGSLAGLALLGWLFKRFVVTPFILAPIRKKKEKAFAAKTEKDIAQMKKDDEEWEKKQKGDK